jgi:hypothetical protein
MWFFLQKKLQNCKSKSETRSASRSPGIKNQNKQIKAVASHFQAPPPQPQIAALKGYLHKQWCAMLRNNVSLVSNGVARHAICVSIFLTLFRHFGENSHFYFFRRILTRRMRLCSVFSSRKVNL